MRNIVICEDIPEQLDNIRSSIEKYLMIEELDLNIVLATSDPYLVLNYIKKQDKGETLYFLDIDLGVDINGIDLAQTIRKEDDLSKIVIITTLSEMMPLVFRYKLEVLDFIIKDNFESIESQVRKCIDTVLSREKLNSQTKEKFTATMGRRTIVVDYQDIYYFQSIENHKIVLVGNNVYYEFYDSLADIIDRTSFTQVHRSYVANIENATLFDKSQRELYFPEDLHIPVGRVYKENVDNQLK
ncbi:LytR/AlgR family response regulator transcription factor [Facklamia sp. P12945]|uniref:LytR/AlgR family response regulator transcription factor n=1 Tax=Facklamia sp. P12945 TaxID=3421950 RepID=UPI003D181336